MTGEKPTWSRRDNAYHNSLLGRSYPLEVAYRTERAGYWAMPVRLGAVGTDRSIIDPTLRLEPADRGTLVRSGRRVGLRALERQTNLVVCGGRNGGETGFRLCSVRSLARVSDPATERERELLLKAWCGSGCWQAAGGFGSASSVDPTQVSPLRGGRPPRRRTCTVQGCGKRSGFPPYVLLRSSN